MDYEKKYNEALERAKKFEEKYGGGYAEYIFPELKESEDERIRKLLVWQVYRNIEDETNDLAQSVYDGIKGHDPDLEESIEDWKKCLAYLEKQKEQKPVEPSDDELQRHQDELYDFKVFAAKQAKEHHISFVHDFEWNNFCAGLLSYFNEQKPAECIEDSVKFEEGFKAGRESGLRDEQKYVLNNLDSYGLCKPAEWSEEDEEMLDIVLTMVDCSTVVPHSGGQLHPSESYKKDISAWLKSLRPSWKPSEEQMEALERASTNKYLSAKQFDILVSLHEDLNKL